MWNCCHLSACSMYAIQPCTSLQCHFIPNNIHRVHVCFSCILPPALLAQWPRSFTCYRSNTRMERIPKQESEQMVDPGEENSPTALTRTWTCDLLILSPTLCRWAIPTPWRVFTTTTLLKRWTGIHCHHFKHWTPQQGEQGQHSGLSSRLVIERSQVRVPAGEFSFIGSTFCANP